jgi:hypothetical protein
MESQPPVANISHHSRNNDANCTECPADSANSLNQKADCASLVQVQALKEASFSIDAPRGVPHIEVVGARARPLALESDGERFSPAHEPYKIRSFNRVSAPLRV